MALEHLQSALLFTNVAVFNRRLHSVGLASNTHLSEDTPGVPVYFGVGAGSGKDLDCLCSRSENELGRCTSRQGTFLPFPSHRKREGQRVCCCCSFLPSFLPPRGGSGFALQSQGKCESAADGAFVFVGETHMVTLQQPRIAQIVREGSGKGPERCTFTFQA